MTAAAAAVGASVLDELPVFASDGTRLHARVHRGHPGSPPQPVILVRTPYDAEAHDPLARSWAQRGYAVVMQDVRGRYRSEGRWEPYEHEGPDGAVALDAVLDAPWCDGRVIVHGASYEAHCAIAAAVARPRSVHAVAVTVPALSLGHVSREPTGTPRLYAHAWWWLQHGDTRVALECPVHDATATDPGILTTLPVIDLDARAGRPDSGWSAAWAVQGSPSSLTTRSTVHLPPAATLPPLFVVAGLHDVYCDDAVDLVDAWPSRADLLVGAWQHDLGLHHREGDGDLVRSRAHRRSVGPQFAAWLNDLADAGDTIAARSASFPRDDHDERFALEGSDRWARRGSESTVLDLTVRRAGFRADPRDPHPSLLGPVDASAALERRDCALFIAPTIDTPLDVVGRPMLTLTGLAATTETGAAIDGPVDWAIRLCMTTQSADDARTPTVQLAHAIIRTTATSCRLPLPLLSRRLHRGTRLQVQVSAYQFPLFARDPHDGSEPLLARTLRPALRGVATASIRLPLGILAEPPIDPPARR